MISKRILAAAVAMACPLMATAGTYTAAVSGAPGQTVTLNVQFAGDTETQDTQVDISYPNANITLSNPVPALGGADVCLVLNATTVRVIPRSGGGSALPSAATTYCSFDVAINGAAPDGLIPFSTSAIECAAPLNPTVTPCELAAGQGVTVATTPIPPTLSFSSPVTTTAGNIGDNSTGTVLVTGAGGAGAGTASYTCVQPSGFTVTNLTQSGIAVGADPADMGVSCTLAAAQNTQNMGCTVTDGAGTNRAVNVSLTCPAGSVPTVDPVITTSPASGSTIVIAGQAFSTGQSTVVLTNSNGSGAGQTTISCSATAPVLIGFVGGAAPSAGPISQVVTGNANPPDLIIQHPLTDADQAVVTGGVVCTQDFANDMGGAQALATFNVDPAAGTVIIPPEVIPASSLWSQLSLIGLLAALGGLFVALRRNA